MSSATPASWGLTHDAESVELGGVWVPRSIPALYQRRVAESPHHLGTWRRGEAGWEGMSMAQHAQRVERIARGLLALGVEPGDRVGILSETRPEWGMIDLAVLHAGAVTVGVYPTLTSEEVAYQLDHAGVEVLLLEDPAQLAKVEAARPAGLCELVLIAPGPGALPAGVRTLEQLERLGVELPEGGPRLAAIWQALGPDDLATLIYTSGTTGPPKGAMLTHGNLAFTAVASADHFPTRPGDSGVVFLPLAHALQRWALYLGLWTGAAGWYARSHQTLMEDLREARPTIQVSVPRIWEKVHDKIVERLASAPRTRQRMFEWALQVGKRFSAAQRRGDPVPLGLRLGHELARRAVYQPLKERLLGGRVRYLTSGGAPIALELLEFFHALDLLILEGWGLTETAAPATVNLPQAFRFGTVGRPLPGVELRLAEDGELLVRGPGVFRGYYNDPEATAAAFTSDGFFRTGDVGEIDGDGYVRITDRKKNIIVMANGKNIAPQNLENRFKRVPLVGNCLVVGDRRNYLVGLFVLDPEAALAWARSRGLVGEPGEDALSILAALPELRAEVDQGIRAVNAELARFEQLKRWELLDEEWSVEDGTLTPTLKTKRRVLEQRHAARLDRLYAAEA